MTRRVSLSHPNFRPTRNAAPPKITCVVINPISLSKGSNVPDSSEPSPQDAAPKSTPANSTARYCTSPRTPFPLTTKCPTFKVTGAPPAFRRSVRVDRRVGRHCGTSNETSPASVAGMKRHVPSGALAYAAKYAPKGFVGFESFSIRRVSR